MLLPSIRLSAARPDRSAVVLDREREGARDDIGCRVGMSGQVPGREQRAGRDAPLRIHRRLRVRPRTDARSGERDNSRVNRQTADRIDLDGAFARRGRIRICGRTERLARSEVNDRVHREVIRRIERHAEVA